MSLDILKKIDKLPVGLIATSLGAATLSNAYMNLNVKFLRPIFMILGMVLIICVTLKIFLHKEIVKNEYKNAIPASVYGTYSMLMMVVGAFISQYYFSFGKIIWSLGIIIHAIFIIIFTYVHVFKNFNKPTFVPSLFIIYNGIMVAAVVGEKMNEPLLLKAITYYGIVIFFLILPFMVKRVMSLPLPMPAIHTKAIFTAPICLCIISYINFVKPISLSFVFFLYALILLSLVYTLVNMKEFFSMDFNPGFGALTFPMAIGVVASMKMSGFLNKINYLSISKFIYGLAIAQIFVTTLIIGFVLYNFFLKKTSK